VCSLFSHQEQARASAAVAEKNLAQATASHSNTQQLLLASQQQALETKNELDVLRKR